MGFRLFVVFVFIFIGNGVYIKIKINFEYIDILKFVNIKNNNK